MDRVTLIAIVEGHTENAFLGNFIGSYLGERGIDLHCPIVRLGAGRGGVRGLRCEDFCNQIQRFLKDSRKPFVTTFFDYYGFPTGMSTGWEFVQIAKAEASIRGLDATVQTIERELHRRATSGLDLPNISARFLPYIQLHELEALYFAEPEKMAQVFENSMLSVPFAKAVTDCKGCERINDSPQTAPSKRIYNEFRGYIKGRSDFGHAPRLAKTLDLNIVRNACPRFSSWMSQLEALPPTESSPVSITPPTHT